jgi:hypothetical protein
MNITFNRNILILTLTNFKLIWSLINNRYNYTRLVQIYCVILLICKFQHAFSILCRITSLIAIHAQSVTARHVFQLQHTDMY